MPNTRGYPTKNEKKSNKIRCPRWTNSSGCLVYDEWNVKYLLNKYHDMTKKDCCHILTQNKDTDEVMHQNQEKPKD